MATTMERMTEPNGAATTAPATMMNFADHFGIRNQLDPLKLASLCQRANAHEAGCPVILTVHLAEQFAHAIRIAHSGRQ